MRFLKDGRFKLQISLINLFKEDQSWGLDGVELNSFEIIYGSKTSLGKRWWKESFNLHLKHSPSIILKMCDINQQNKTNKWRILSIKTRFYWERVQFNKFSMVTLSIKKRWSNNKIIQPHHNFTKRNKFPFWTSDFNIVSLFLTKINPLFEKILIHQAVKLNIFLSTKDCLAYILL